MKIEVEDFTQAMIELRTRNDIVTLEYDDTVILFFSPDEPDLIELYESEGEYIREHVVINIVDSDRESTKKSLQCLLVVMANVFYLLQN